jgi:uncharacterized cupredoxin-like copper-binding protein
MRVHARFGIVSARTGEACIMPGTIERDPESTSPELAQELHDLEAQEEKLERRTRSLEVSGPLALIFSLFALALGIGALAIALANRSDNTSTPSGTSNVAGSAGQSTGMMGSTAAGMMTGAGGHGSFSTSMMSAAARGTVYVQLGDYWAAPAVSSIRAGKVTFVAKNVGRVPHELMVERMPMKFDSPMHPNEDAAQGMIADMDPGHSGRMTMRLRPGTYMLFCNVSGHYAAGQHIPFTVTNS